MTLLLPPSTEQSSILHSIRQGYHVIGDCVAGSGKTTTVLHLAKAFPKRHILQITYNAQLKSEVRAKADMLGITNLEVHTYHSLAVRYYNPNAHDDTTLRSIVRHNGKPRSLPRTHMLVLDESQDMTLLYFCLIRKFLQDHHKDLQIVILGDRYQSIYQFKDADARYLTMAHEIWDQQTLFSAGIQARAFLPVGLTTSYRVTRPIAAFVNTCMLDADRITAVRDGPKVQLVKCNTFSVHRYVGEMLLELLNSESVKPEDIFVLAGSIKGDMTPIRRLENLLVEAHIPCYYPTSDEGRLDETVVEGKVVFSTFHQAKGRERSVVVIYGFDNSYFKYFGKEYDPHVCPETLYVAATRARTRLILLESVSEGPLPFLKCQQPSDFLEFKGKEKYLNLMDFGFCGQVMSQTKQTEQHRSSVTELTKFLNERSLELLTAIADQVFTEEQKELYTVNIPSKIQTPTGSEDISDINGIVIPAMFEAKMSKEGQSTIEIDVRNTLLDLQANQSHLFLQTAASKLPSKIERVEEFLQLGVVYNAFTEKVYHRLQQIKDVDWLTEDAVQTCFQSLTTFDEDTIFEQPIESDVRHLTEYGHVFLSGRMDAITDECVWEFKCVDNLTLEHQMQLLTYAWMWRREHEEEYGSREFRLLNIRTGQIKRLDATSPFLEDAIRILFENKWAKRDPLSDTRFVERCLQGISDTISATPTRSTAQGWLGDE
jgi:hypothetical protein